MNTIRKPVVSGTFYPQDSDELRKLIKSYLDSVDLPRQYNNDILGVISPHAGYVFSGQCAAYAFQQLAYKDFDTAIVIAPSHQCGDFYFSVGDYDAYQTPLGKINVDRELAEQLLTDSKFVFYPYAHNSEHSLEVQLPFLQIIKPQVKILPILIGYQYDLSSDYLGKILSSLLAKRMDKTVFIASSDLSHYHNSRKAELLDKNLISAIESLDFELLWKVIKEKKGEACGFGGILTMLNIAKTLRYDKAKTLCYTHSGETSGDHSQVVGYLAGMFYK